MMSPFVIEMSCHYNILCHPFQNCPPLNLKPSRGKARMGVIKNTVGLKTNAQLYYEIVITVRDAKYGNGYWANVGWTG